MCFAQPIAVLMQAPEESLDLTVSYMRICGSGIFFIVDFNSLSAIFRGLGSSKSPLLFVLVACVVNIAGDLLLVTMFHMDAAGAALATFFAQTVSVVCAVVKLLIKKLPFTIYKEDFTCNSQFLKFLEAGLSLALQECLTQRSFLALCAFINRLGMLEAVGEVSPEAKYQHCTVHLYRNVFSVTPRSKVKLVAKTLKAIHAQKSKKAAREKAKAVVEELRSMKLKEAAKKVGDGIEETLIYCDFPSEHWTRIRTNNCLERLNREIRRRTRVAGSFPDSNSALTLVCARLRHVAGTQWCNRM